MGAIAWIMENIFIKTYRSRGVCSTIVGGCFLNGKFEPLNNCTLIFLTPSVWKGLPNVDFDKALAAKTVLEFDENFTAPLHGYKDAMHYYTTCQPGPKLDRIQIDTLIIRYGTSYIYVSIYNLYGNFMTCYTSCTCQSQQVSFKDVYVFIDGFILFIKVSRRSVSSANRL